MKHRSISPVVSAFRAAGIEKYRQTYTCWRVELPGLAKAGTDSGKDKLRQLRQRGAHGGQQDWGLTLVDWVGLWGGVVSTIVLIWDVIKWRLTGPRLRLLVQPRMRTINYPGLDGKHLVVVTVTNVGDRPSTITNVGILYYRSLCSRLRRRADTAAIVNQPSDAYPLPYVVDPGAQWMGFAEQTDDILDMGKSGWLYFAVYHSSSKRAIRRRVRFAPSYQPKPLEI